MAWVAHHANRKSTTMNTTINLHTNSGSRLAGRWHRGGPAGCRAASRPPGRIRATSPMTSGRAILLTGSHTWNNLVDMGPTDPPAPFRLRCLSRLDGEAPSQLLPLWAWELLSWDTRGNREKEAVTHHVGRSLGNAPDPARRWTAGQSSIWSNSTTSISRD